MRATTPKPTRLSQKVPRSEFVYSVPLRGVGSLHGCFGKDRSVYGALVLSSILHFVKCAAGKANPAPGFPPDSPNTHRPGATSKKIAGIGLTAELMQMLHMLCTIRDLLQTLLEFTLINRVAVITVQYPEKLVQNVLAARSVFLSSLLLVMLVCLFRVGVRAPDRTDSRRVLSHFLRQSLEIRTELAFFHFSVMIRVDRREKRVHVRDHFVQAVCVSSERPKNTSAQKPASNLQCCGHFQLRYYSTLSTTSRLFSDTCDHNPAVVHSMRIASHFPS